MTSLAEDIRAHLERRFARWQLPDEFLFVESIPKTSVGKINKKAIRETHKEVYQDGRRRDRP